MGNFNIFDFLNAVNNNPAAKNALDKIFSKNAAHGSRGNTASGKERLRPSVDRGGQSARFNTSAENQTEKPAYAKKAPAAKQPRYSDNSLLEIVKRHDALSKQIDEQNGENKAALSEKEKQHLTFPTRKI